MPNLPSKRGTRPAGFPTAARILQPPSSREAHRGCPTRHCRSDQLHERLPHIRLFWKVIPQGSCFFHGLGRNCRSRFRRKRASLIAFSSMWGGGSLRTPAVITMFSFRRVEVAAQSRSQTGVSPVIPWVPRATILVKIFSRTWPQPDAALGWPQWWKCPYFLQVFSDPIPSDD